MPLHGSRCIPPQPLTTESSYAFRFCSNHRNDINKYTFIYLWQRWQLRQSSPVTSHFSAVSVERVHRLVFINSRSIVVIIIVRWLLQNSESCPYFYNGRCSDELFDHIPASRFYHRSSQHRDKTRPHVIKPWVSRTTCFSRSFLPQLKL